MCIRDSYKVSHAGQSQTRHGRAAARFDKAAHLGKAARHDQSGGVVPQSDAVRGAYGDGDDVLEGGAYLGAHNIVAYIRAKGVGCEKPLEEQRRIAMGRRDDRARSNAPDDFLGMIRPRKRGEARRIAELLLEHLDGKKTGAGLDALRANDNRRILCLLYTSRCV